MIRLVLALGLMLTSACTLDLPVPNLLPPGKLTITSPARDPGGVIAARIAEIEGAKQLAARGIVIERRIGGECLSACTLYLGSPAACFTRDAVLGFHGPAGPAPDYAALDPTRHFLVVEMMARYYPEPLRDWFRDGPAKERRLTRIAASDLIDRGLAKECDL